MSEWKPITLEQKDGRYLLAGEGEESWPPVVVYWDDRSETWWQSDGDRNFAEEDFTVFLDITPPSTISPGDCYASGEAP